MTQDLLTETFIRHRQKLKMISRRILPETMGVEDVLQDSFVRLWQRQYPIQSEKEAEALLSRTVRNVSLNARRGAKAVPLRTDFADEQPDVEEREAAYAEVRQKIGSVLTQVQRFILEEREYGGRTLEDIAKELGMEAPAVRMQLSRARKALRNAIQNDR